MTVEIYPLGTSTWADDLMARVALGPDRYHLLVDGTCRKAVHGVFDLDLDDIVIAPLLNPNKDGSLSEVGAYVVDLGATLAALGPGLFQRQFVDKWGEGHAVLMQADMPMADLARHLRKFLRLKREDDGTFVYLRFWDARVALPYLSGLSAMPERLTQWLRPVGRAPVKEIIFEHATPAPGVRMVPNFGLLPERSQAIRPVLSLPEIALLNDTNKRQFDVDTALGLAAGLGSTAPAGLHDGDKGPAFVAHARRDAASSGITTRTGVARWALLATVLGVRFAHRPWPNLRDLGCAGSTSRRPSESEILLAYVEIAQVVRSARQAALQRAQDIADGASFELTAGELRRSLPDWIGQLPAPDCAGMSDHFLSLSPQFETASPPRLAICAALTGVFGLWWPLDPLRSTMLNDMCNNEVSMDRVAQRLAAIEQEIGAENEVT